MPLLAAFLASVAGSIVSFFVQFVGRRVAVVAAYLTLVASSLAAVVVSINALITSISASLPNESYIQLGLAFLPSNFDDCIGTIIAYHVAIWGWSWYNHTISSMLRAN